VSDLKPGWADAYGAGLSEKLTEEERCEATGLRPRRSFRGWIDISQESRLRGAHKPNKAPGKPKYGARS
jgi:hypothetical protein